METHIVYDLCHRPTRRSRAIRPLEGRPTFLNVYDAQVHVARLMGSAVGAQIWDQFENTGYLVLGKYLIRQRAVTVRPRNRVRRTTSLAHR